MYVFRLVGIFAAWIGIHLSLKREDRLIFNASPSFEREDRKGKVAKCSSTIRQQTINTVGCLTAFIATMICLVNHLTYQIEWIDRVFSLGLLAIPLAIIPVTVMVFNIRKRLRKWIRITNGKKHLSLKEKQEAVKQTQRKM